MAENVLITGAAGRVGTAVWNYLSETSDYKLTGIDVEDRQERDIHGADITDYSDIRPYFDEQDVVIHLARPKGNLSPFSTRTAWNGTFEDNLVGITNVFHAAVEADVERIIYASSHHVMGMYEFEHQPDIYEPDYDLVLDETSPPRPDSLYAVTKLFAESIGRLIAEAHDMRFYSLRLGNLRDPDHPYVDAEMGVEDGDWERGSTEYENQVNRLKASWLSHRDAGQLFQSCIEDSTVMFDIFYGVSANSRRWFDLTHARETIGYEPQDNSEDWTSPPENS